MKKDQHAKCKVKADQQARTLHSIINSFDNDMLFDMLIERYQGDIYWLDSTIEEEKADNENHGWTDDTAIVSLKKQRKLTEKAIKLFGQAKDALATCAELEEAYG